MNKPVGTLRNESRAWVEVPAEDNGDAMIAAMAEAGVDYVFFTSGSEIGFYQEAIAKAHAKGRRAMSRMPSGSGAAGSATPSCVMVGNLAPLTLATDTSRGNCI